MSKKIDTTRPVRTRDGRSVKISVIDMNAGDYPIFGRIEGLNKDTAWSLDGKHEGFGGFGDYQKHMPEDLVNV